MEFLKNQITNKSGFLIYRDYWEKYFSKMTGEQVKEVFKIVFHFNLTFEILETDDLAVEMVIATIIDNIKRDAVKRTKRAIASVNNGKLGGRPKKEAKPKQTKSRTEAKPTIEEIKNYCLERKNTVNAEKFYNHYEANGWKVGKNSMKDWKAAVRTWEANDFTNKKSIHNNFQEQDYSKGTEGFEVC